MNSAFLAGEVVRVELSPLKCCLKPCAAQQIGGGPPVLLPGRG